MACYGAAAKRDAWTGTGVGVGSLALPLVVIDAFNDVRASRYLDRVRAFEPSVGIGPSPTTPWFGGVAPNQQVARGWQLTLGGRF
jgi:hypothetical protein